MDTLCEQCGKDVGEFDITEVQEKPERILCFDCFVKSLKLVPSDHKIEGEILAGGNPYKGELS